MTTKKKELDFDFAEGMNDQDETNIRQNEEVVTVKKDEKSNTFDVVNTEPLVEKSAGPGMTVRRTQEQEETLSFNKGLFPNRPADKVVGGLDPVDEEVVSTTDLQGNRIKDVRHTNK